MPVKIHSLDNEIFYVDIEVIKRFGIIRKLILVI